MQFAAELTLREPAQETHFSFVSKKTWRYYCWQSYIKVHIMYFSAANKVVIISVHQYMYTVPVTVSVTPGSPVLVLLIVPVFQHCYAKSNPSNADMFPFLTNK